MPRRPDTKSTLRSCPRPPETDCGRMRRSNDAPGSGGQRLLDPLRREREAPDARAGGVVDRIGHGRGHCTPAPARPNRPAARSGCRPAGCRSLPGASANLEDRIAHPVVRGDHVAGRTVTSSCSVRDRPWMHVPFDHEPEIARVDDHAGIVRHRDALYGRPCRSARFTSTSATTAMNEPYAASIDMPRPRWTPPASRRGVAVGRAPSGLFGDRFQHRHFTFGSSACFRRNAIGSWPVAAATSSMKLSCAKRV